MKSYIEVDGVTTAEYSSLISYKTNGTNYLGFPCIIKHVHSSRGKGIYMINNKEELNAFYDKRTNGKLCEYIIEKYYNYTREYRLHVTKDGCFYASRKMLKNNAEERWHRHHTNTVWINEDNPKFDKPNSWDLIVKDCIKAMDAVGLDI